MSVNKIILTSIFWLLSISSIAQLSSETDKRYAVIMDFTYYDYNSKTNCTNYKVGGFITKGAIVKVVAKSCNNLSLIYRYGEYGLIPDVILVPVSEYYAKKSKTTVSEPTISEQIKSEVQLKFETWLAKGEYEKTVDYQNRVSSKNREEKLEEITIEVYNSFKDDFVQNININDRKIEEYDADLELFPILFENKPTYLKVPITEAKEFKTNFNSTKFSDFDAKLNKEDNWVITKYTAYFEKLNKSYYYDIEDRYASLPNNKLSVKSEDLNIEIPYSEQSNSARENRVTKVTYGPSDVNNNIPINSSKNLNTFCLIIGNEDYSSRQNSLNTEINVPFAVDDAKYFSIYANKTLGIPHENIFVLYNATKSEILQKIDKLTKLAKFKNGTTNLLFYYAGHGLPDEITREQYLIPVDVSGVNLQYAIKVNDIITSLSSCNAERVTIVLDACFSGGARNQGLIATRGVKIQPKSNVVEGNVVVFTSSTGSQSSNAYDEKQHGMFTYFILKKLQETKGEVDYGELFEYVKKEVEYNSVLKNDKVQTPEMNVSQSVYNYWRNWSFK